VKRYTNEGALALAPHLQERGKKAALADAMGIDRGLVSRWAAGTLRPCTQNRLELKQRLGIDISAWDRRVPVRKVA
jgi:transcriptional regulator with XRE-family HTH domain